MNSKARFRFLESYGKIKEDSFDFELIEKYFRNKNHENVFQVLSDKTCNDLDFQELFMFLDRTNSKIGQQFLYNRLRTIEAGSEKSEFEDDFIRYIEVNPDKRVEMQYLIERLNKSGTYYITSLFQDEYQNKPKWFFMVPILAFTNILALLLLPFNFQLIFVFTVVSLINIVIHLWNKKTLYQYSGSIPQLLVLNDVARKLYKNDFCKKIDPSLPDSIKVLDKIKRRMAFFKLESMLDGDFAVFFWAFMELLKSLFLIEPLMLFEVLKVLNTRKIQVENVYNFVGNVDVLISISSLRNGLENYCIPEVTKSGNSIIAKDVYHPLIIDCIKNSITVEDKSILLTGSNMSGKTSFIRTIGLNLITGLTLNTCFAEKMRIPRVRIFSAIRISDNLLNDRSYYFEEVLTIKEMINNCKNDKSNLFLLDEIFKGTNTVERISAGKAVLSSLSKDRNIVFVSTHDIELADLLADEYDLYHFSEIVDNKTVDFDYKIKSGKLKNRNAIKILQLNDYPESIIEEAIEISKEIDWR